MIVNQSYLINDLDSNPNADIRIVLPNSEYELFNKTVPMMKLHLNVDKKLTWLEAFTG